jgi:sulfur-oxidizing protein SoxY
MKAWLALALCVALPAQANDAEARLAAFLADAALRDGLEVTLAQGVEDGAFVPVDVQLRGARAPLELLILRSGEDDPRIARIRLTRWQEPLRLSTRVRLPASQALIVAARDADGRRWLWRRDVQVYASSCAQAPTSDPLAGLGEFRVWGERNGDELELRALLRHPMETGRRPDGDGRMLARRLLREFRLTDERGELLVLQPFEGLSANPLVRVVLPARGSLRLRWEDADGTLYRDGWPR